MKNTACSKFASGPCNSGSGLPVVIVGEVALYGLIPGHLCLTVGLSLSKLHVSTEDLSFVQVYSCTGRRSQPGPGSHSAACT